MTSSSTSTTRLASSSPSPSSEPKIKEIYIPHFTEEGLFLERISKFVRTERVDDGSAEGHLEVVKVDWKGVALNIFHKEIFRQFMHGLIWTTSALIVTEVFSFVCRRSSSLFGIRRMPLPKFGGFTTRMRDFAKSFARGEANIVPTK